MLDRLTDWLDRNEPLHNAIGFVFVAVAGLYVGLHVVSFVTR